MNWIWFLCLPLGLGLIALFALFLILGLILYKTGGYAPGWQVRCTSCNKTREASEVGVIKIGAACVGERTVGWCSQCKKRRVLAIEKKRG